MNGYLNAWEITGGIGLDCGVVVNFGGGDDIVDDAQVTAFLTEGVQSCEKLLFPWILCGIVFVKKWWESICGCLGNIISVLLARRWIPQCLCVD